MKRLLAKKLVCVCVCMCKQKAALARVRGPTITEQRKMQQEVEQQQQREAAEAKKKKKRGPVGDLGGWRKKVSNPRHQRESRHSVPSQEAGDETHASAGMRDAKKKCRQLRKVCFVSFRFVSYLTLSTEHKAYRLHDPSVL